MKKENRRCWNCFYYDAFYTKGVGCFKQEKIGACNKHDKTVTKQDTCGDWIVRPLARAQRTATPCLAEICERLAEVEQILKEEQEYEKKVMEAIWGT